MAAASIVGYYLAMSAILGQSEGHLSFSLGESTIPHVTFTLSWLEFVVFGSTTRSLRNRPPKENSPIAE